MLELRAITSEGYSDADLGHLIRAAEEPQELLVPVDITPEAGSIL